MAGRLPVAKTYKLFIDGAARPAEGGRTAPSLDPATEEPWAQVAAAGVADADAAVAAETAKRLIAERRALAA